MPDGAGSDVSIRLRDLKDVDRKNPQTGDVLTFGGTHWAPGAASGGGSASPWVYNTVDDVWVSYVGPVPANFTVNADGPIKELEYVTDNGQVGFYVSPDKINDLATEEIYGRANTYQTYWWPGINADDVWQTNQIVPLSDPAYLYLTISGPANDGTDPEPTVGSAAAIMLAAVRDFGGLSKPVWPNQMGPVGSWVTNWAPWYGGGAGTTHNVGGDIMLGGPMFVGRDITFDAIGLDVTTANGATLHILVYHYDRKTNLLKLDFLTGALTADSTGIKWWSVDGKLKQGEVYWTLVQGSGPTSQVRSVYTGSMAQALTWDDDWSSGPPQAVFMSQTWDVNNLPDNIDILANSATMNDVPMVGFRLAA